MEERGAGSVVVPDTTNRELSLQVDVVTRCTSWNSGGLQAPICFLAVHQPSVMSNTSRRPYRRVRRSQNFPPTTAPVPRSLQTVPLRYLLRCRSTGHGALQAVREQSKYITVISKQGVPKKTKCKTKQAFHGLCGPAGLKFLFDHANFFPRAILSCKLGQTDLVFGVRSGFISRSEHARLYTSLCTAVTICATLVNICLLYTSPSPRDRTRSRMPSSA